MRIVPWKNTNKTVYEKILLQNEIGNTTKYYSVNLFINGKSTKKLVHKLEAEAFLGEIKNGMAVNHKDNNSLNNMLDNLEIVSISDNVKQSWSNNHKSPKPYKCVVYDTVTDEEKTFNNATEASKWIGTTPENIINHLKGIWSGISLGRYIIKNN